MNTGRPTRSTRAETGLRTATRALRCGVTALLALLCALVGLPATPSEAGGPSPLDPSFGDAGVVRIDTGGRTLDIANGASQGVIAGSAGGNLALADPGRTVSYGEALNGGRVIFDFDRPSAAFAVTRSGDSVTAAGFAGDDLAVVGVKPDSAPDRAFGRDGMVTTSFGGPAVARAIAQHSDGYLAAGEAQIGEGGSLVMAQYNRRGELSPYFGDGGKVVLDLTPGQDAARAVLVPPNSGNPDPDLVVVGQAGPDAFIAAFTIDGRPDLTFGIGGRVVVNLSAGADVANAVALSFESATRGRGFLVSGSAGGTPFVARFLRDGTPDPTFGVAGVALVPIEGSFEGFESVTAPSYEVTTIGAAGRVRRGNTIDVALVRLTLDGLPDTRFARTGTAVVDLGGAEDQLAGADATYARGEPDPYQLGAFTFVVLGSDGRDFVKMYIDESGQAAAPKRPDYLLPGQPVYRLDLGTPSADGANLVARQPDGKLIVAGSWGGGGLLLARLRSDGTRDPSFHRNQPAVREAGLGTPQDLQLQPDGRILVMVRSGSGVGARLLRFLPTGELDWTFGFRGEEAFNGSWIAGGELDMPVPQGTPVAVIHRELLGRLPDGRWMALMEGGTFLDTRAQVQVYKADGYLDQSFATKGVSAIDMGHPVRGVDLLVQPDGRVILVLSAGNGDPRLQLLRMSSNGALDRSFGAGDVVSVPQLPGVGRSTLTPDGSVVVAGTGFTPNASEETDALVVRYRPGRPSSVASGPVLQMPFSIWEQPTSTPLDGIGSWVINANTPAAAGGQVGPTYLEGHVFNFAESSAQGVVSLVTDPAGRFVTFSATGPDGTPHGAAIPFQWEGSRAYFTYVYQLAPGTWGAWIYDQTAASWTEIGVLYLPQEWGRLSAVSVTTVAWYGPTAGRCSAYPRADAFFYPPIGYVGGSATVGRFLLTAALNDDCLAETSMSGDWARYRVGADA